MTPVLRPLSPCAVTAWAMRNAALHITSRDQASPGEFERIGLQDQSAALGLPGLWGRVSEPLAVLQDDLARNDNRANRLLACVLGDLAGDVTSVIAKYGPSRVAIVLGSSTGGIDRTEAALAQERQSGLLPDWYHFGPTHTYNSLITVTRKLTGAAGPAYIVSTACSSSGKALAAAQRMLDVGIADAVIVGGADGLCETTLRGFAGLGIMGPEGCRPFDASRAGISIGEGAAALILERPTGPGPCLLGVGESNDAYHPTAPHPEGLGAIAAMHRALTLGGVAPDQVAYINAHGTATKQNDVAESTAIAKAFGRAVPFSSTKDRTGHLLGTAAITEAIYTLLGLRLGVKPQNRLPNAPDESLPLQPILSPEEQAWRPEEPKVALSNSFAFGGSNVSVLLGDSQPGPRAVSPPARVFIMGRARWFPETEGAKPKAELLPVRARGRASEMSRIAAELYGQLLEASGTRVEEESLHLILGSAFGELGTTLFLLDQLATEATLSPAKFQGSVHNTAIGLLTLERQNRGYATAIAAGRDSLAMSLLDAWCMLGTQGGDAFILVGDEAGPPRLLRGETFPPLGVGFWLRSAATPPEDAIAEITEFPIALEERSTPECQLVVPGARGPVTEAPASWGLELHDALGGEPKAGELQTIRIGPRYGLRLRLGVK